MEAAGPELREQLVSDLPPALALLGSLQEQVVGVTAHVQGLLQRVRAGAFPTEKGLSFLELKAQLLLLYLQDLAQLLLEKSSGRSLAAQPAVLRLAELRTVLEKMRPIEQKLRYQVDKLVKAAVTGAVGDDNPLRFKPDPGNMMSKLSDEEVGTEGKAAGKKPLAKGGVRKYVPPRLVPVHYDETEAEREKKALDQAKKRALSSSVIRELKEQFSDAPEEIREGRYLHATRQSQEDAHRRSYEEAMLVRLNLSRQDKARRRRVAAMGAQLHSLTHFGDISALTGAAPLTGEDLSPPKKRRKKTNAKKGRKKGFRRR
ncbi:neuroguidin isoform X2 [Dermochelys coriacea]|uniref:neuroguidin isoform X2 n=1 Tax=Dermochelys coriacea TaxID=27794 RepID=UPI0018E7B0CE|nr:neuroguidin isoform X2 [Dermochelys coriacea]